MSVMFGRSSCEDGSRAPFALSVTTSTIAAVLCVITVPGNVMISWSIIKDPNSELRTPFNCLVLNLAIADLTTGTITEPLFAVFHAREAMSHASLNLMRIVHVAYFISCTASLLSIGVLAIERYLTVTSLHRRRCSRSRALAVSMVIWTIAIAISCLYFATSFYIFLFIFVNTTVVATFAIIIFAYIRIHRSLHARVVQSQETQVDRIVEHSFQYEKKATRSFIIVLVFFVCCNLSSLVMVYVINFCDTCNCNAIHWLRDYQFLMALVNGAANQFLYAWRMPKFVRVFKQAMPWSLPTQSSSGTENLQPFPPSQ